MKYNITVIRRTECITNNHCFGDQSNSHGSQYIYIYIYIYIYVYV